MKLYIALSSTVLFGGIVALVAACSDNESTLSQAGSTATTGVTTTSAVTSTTTSGSGGAGGQGTGGQGAGGHGGQGTGGQGAGGHGGQGTGGGQGSGGAGGGAQSLCVKTGGTAHMQLCCAASSAFPDTCGVGACSCSPNSSKQTEVCECPVKQCYDQVKGCIPQG